MRKSLFTERKWETVFLLIEEAAIACVIAYYLFVADRPDHAFKFFITMFVVMIPLILGLLLSARALLPIYCFAAVYASGHTVASCFGFYLTCPWWDKGMHFAEGFLITMVAYYVLQQMFKGTAGRKAAILAAAVSFSVLIAVLWEIAEFTADRFFVLDMQKDVYVTHMDSYLLGGNTGDIETIGKIESVTVNGKELPGYIDVGLTDTMYDLITSLGGSLLFLLYALFDRDRHPLIRFLKSSETEEKGFDGEA